jgi:hypothetical protein
VHQPEEHQDLVEEWQKISWKKNNEEKITAKKASMHGRRVLVRQFRRALGSTLKII